MQPYKVYLSNRIYGVGQVYVVIAVDDHCLSGNLSIQNYKAVEYYVFHICDQKLKRVIAEKLVYTGIPEVIIPHDSLIDQAFNVAKPQADLLIHEKRESIKPNGLLIPYNAEFQFKEASFPSLVVAAKQFNFCDTLAKIYKSTSNTTLHENLSSIRLSHSDWSIRNEPIDL